MMNERAEPEGVLSVIGNTPLVKLSRFFENAYFNVFAKLELLNPGGSMKDRAAMFMIKDAVQKGEIKPGTTVIESSSGNMAIGLALSCAYYGLKLICVVDSKTSEQNLKILKAYGAQIDLVSEPDPVSGDFLQARIDRVKSLLKTVENSYWPCQYTNENNPLSHYYTTMQEISSALDRIDFLFCAVSTCGTLKGCIDYIHDNQMGTKVFAVDAAGSVIFGGKKGKRLLPGHGASVEPFFSQNGIGDLIEDCIRVTDLDCVIGCRRLVRSEAILAGGSAGGVLMAVEKAGNRIPPGSNCVVILPDRGERYLDTVYSDDWVRENFGDISV